MDHGISLWILGLALVVIADAGCLSGWRRVNDTCYSGVMTGPQDWGIARAHCQSFGGDLLVFDSEEDISAIEATLDISTVWVGCHDRLIAGEWLCARKIMGSLVGWAEGQPSMQGCIYANSTWEIHVDDCAAKKQYVCEAHLDQVTSDLPANCPTEWVEWNGRCYYYSYQPMSWDLADGYCRDAVSSLVAFQTASERDGVRDLFPGPDVWIGCNNREGISEWSCPETQDPFFDFETSSPSADVADQCLMMGGSGSYGYDSCSGASYNFVCRMPLGQYKGCFRDASVRTFAVGPLGGHLNLRNCMERCNGHNFVLVGLQAGGQCFCGNTGYLRLGRKPDWECRSHCSGQAGQYCGSGWTNTVYKVGSKADVVERKYAVVKNRKLNSGVHAQLSEGSTASCIDRCTRSTQCIALNFCKTGADSGTCELSHDRKDFVPHSFDETPDCEYAEIVPV